MACLACGSLDVDEGTKLCAPCTQAGMSPVRRVPGIGAVRENRLLSAGIETLGALWQAPLADVAAAAQVSTATAEAWQEAARAAMAMHAEPASSLDGQGATEAWPAAEDVADAGFMEVTDAPHASPELAAAGGDAYADGFEPAEDGGGPDAAWPEAPAPTPRRRVLGAVLIFVAVALLLGCTWLLLDLDGDGLSASRELGIGSNPMQFDTDHDGLSDGHEVAIGTDPGLADSDGDHLVDGMEEHMGTSPTNPDTDSDGIPDDLELAWGADPLRSDSDRDGLSDPAELDCGVATPSSLDVVRASCSATTDCNHNGKSALIDPDDDSDLRTDGLETPGQRCKADTDGDGVLDGAERNTTCIELPDCDGDGVPDGLEDASRFSPLDSDTFNSGLGDFVTYTFEHAGQPFTADADGDGIPDGWETTSGVLDWGNFTPTPGRRDLLVEFIRLEGPTSGASVGDVDFKPAYDAVKATMLRESGITMQYQETRVHKATEPVANVLAAFQDPTYRDAIERGRFGDNPFVTTIVLLPSVVQPTDGPGFSGLADGFMGFLAAVDYGDYAKHSFSGTTADGRHASIELYPADEEQIIAGRVQNAFLSTTGDVIVQESYGFYEWQPHWFAAQPVLHLTDGTVLFLGRTGIVVDQQSLAHTILHEMGHSLGLCHAHLADCNAAFSPADRAAQATSTMSYDSSATTLHFLPSEWTQVLDDLKCPAGSTLGLLANGASTANVTADKYSGGGLRRCDHVAKKRLSTQFQPDTSMQPYVQQASFLDRGLPAWRDASGATWLFAGFAGLTVAVLGVFLFRRVKRPRRLAA